MRKIAFVGSVALGNNAAANLTREDEDQIQALVDGLDVSFGFGICAPYLGAYQTATLLTKQKGLVDHLNTLRPQAGHKPYRAALDLWTRVMRIPRDQSIVIVSEPVHLVPVVRAYFGASHQALGLVEKLERGTALWLDCKGHQVIRSGLCHGRR